MKLALFYLGLMLAAASKSFAHPEIPGPTASYMYNGPAVPLLQKTVWMASLSNTKRLRELSIIGTHDSASYSSATPPNRQCQMLEIKEQLEYGIRFLDIKLRQVGTSLFADEPNSVDFKEDVLEIANEFVRTHPTETVLIRISARDPGGIISPTVYNEYISGYRVEGIWYANHEDPFLGQVRGKMVMLDNWSNHKTETHHEYGLGFKSRIFTVQEQKTMSPDPFSRYNKWLLYVRPFFSTPSVTFVVNFVSDESSVVKPWSSASGHQIPSEFSPLYEKTGLIDAVPPTMMFEYPRVPTDCNPEPPTCLVSYEGLNTLAYTYMPTSFVGIVVFDFPGHGLMSKVIGMNRSTLPNNVNSTASQ